MITLRADTVALLQSNLVDDRAAGRAFVPQAFRHVGLLFPERLD